MKLLITLTTLLIFSHIFPFFDLFENDEEGFTEIDSTIAIINENSFEADDDPTTLKLKRFKATKDSIYINFTFIDGYRSDYIIGSATKLDGSPLNVSPTNFTKDYWIVSGAGGTDGVILKGVGSEERTIEVTYPFHTDKGSIFNYIEILDPKVEGSNLIPGSKKFTLVIKQLKDITLSIDNTPLIFNNGVATYSVDSKRSLNLDIRFNDKTIEKQFKIK
jgi:hypothetical protein